QQQSQSYPPEKEWEQFRNQGHPPSGWQNQNPPPNGWQNQNLPPNGWQNHNQPQGQWQGQSGPYDPLQDPNVYKVKPQKVNITLAPQEHLNPSYGQYLERDKERIKNGDYPKPPEMFKHGAPLEPGHKNPNQRAGGSSFPGRGGATYNNAAN
ncbi:uncharacterized protein CANTADRAFT_42700, partial [Suhomyces tanzawaensis NRRL Y-17324]